MRRAGDNTVLPLTLKWATTIQVLEGIRYFGFLANTHRKAQLCKIRQLLNAPDPATNEEEAQQQGTEQAPNHHCPHCKEGLMWPIDMAPRPRLSEVLDLPLLVPT